MTDEEKAAQLEAENQAKEEADAKAKAEAEAKSTEQEDYYKKQLTQLNESLEKQKQIIEHKNRAIESLKKGNDEKLEEFRISLREELVGEFKKTLVSDVKDLVYGDRLETEIAKYAGKNEDAAKLIKLHYDKVFKNSEIHESLADKVKAAAMSVNQDLILNIGVKEGMEAKREEILSAFSAPSSPSNPDGTDESDPVYKMLKEHKPDALKNPKVLEKIRR